MMMSLWLSIGMSGWVAKGKGTASVVSSKLLCESRLSMGSTVSGFAHLPLCAFSHQDSLEICPSAAQFSNMSKVEQIEGELQKLSPAELRQVRAWLDDFVEDGLDFTPEFESAIRESEQEMTSGLQPRVRKP